MRMRPGPPGGRSGRGFLLAASVSIVFVMVLVAIMIGNKNRVLHGFTMDAETEAMETEGVSYLLGQIRGLMQGNGTPAPESFRIAPLPPPTATTVLYGTTPDQKVLLNGNLTVAQHTMGEPCGYGSSTPAGGASSLSVPTCHSSVVATASIADDPSKPKQKYAAVSTGCYPYGMLALGGNLNIKSARSVTAYNTDPGNPDSNISPLLVRVYSSGFFNITNGINGRACTTRAPLPVINVGGSSGALYYNCTAMTMPGDFNAQLAAFKPASVVGVSNTLQTSFDHIHAALHHDLGVAYAAALADEAISRPPGGSLIRPVDPSNGKNYTDRATYQFSATVDYDTPNGNLQVGTSMRIPRSDGQELKFRSVHIRGDLWLEENAVLHLTGNLQVDGNIYLGTSATLVVDGTTQAAGLSTTYTKADSAVDLTSTLYGKGTVTFTDGMTKATCTWSGETPSLVSNPYPDTVSPTWLYPTDPPTTSSAAITNLLNTAFATAQGIDLATYSGDHMENCLGRVNKAGVTSTDVPGVFVTSDSNLSINSGDKAVGLFVAAGVSLGVRQMVGCVWSSADINAPNTDYRYFPYYQHVIAHSCSGITMLAAIEQHLIAYGKLP